MSYLEGFVLGSLMKEDRAKRKKMSRTPSEGHRTPWPRGQSLRGRDLMVVGWGLKEISAHPGA